MGQFKKFKKKKSCIHIAKEKKKNYLKNIK